MWDPRTRNTLSAFHSLRQEKEMEVEEPRWNQAAQGWAMCVIQGLMLVSMVVFFIMVSHMQFSVSMTLDSTSMGLISNLTQACEKIASHL